jgi:hypothetical protein
MTTGFDILVDGSPVTEIGDLMTSLEVEEHADRPGAFTLTVPAQRTEAGDYAGASDPRLAPFSNVSVVARDGDARKHCLIDGYVLAQRLQLESSGGAGEVRVWGQDASWLMNMTERAREWADVTDGAVANSIFGEYGFAPDAGNLQDDSPAHAEAGHSLMQRATDAQFLQALARRSGKLCRVFCEDLPGVRTGWFGKPKLDGEPRATLSLSGPDANIGAIEIGWDVMRPTEISAHQALFSSTETAGGDTADGGLSPLDARDLAAFAGQPLKAMLTTIVDDGGELTSRAQGTLREAGWFVRCSGVADAGVLGAILRAGTVVALEAVGSVHSGNYLVWSVRHALTRESHSMAFTLVRNAVGPAGAEGLTA